MCRATSASCNALSATSGLIIIAGTYRRGLVEMGGLSRSGLGTSDTREAPAPAQWKECLRWVCRTRSQTGFRF